MLGPIIALLFRLLGSMTPDRASAVCGGLTRRIGPWLPVHRIGRDNLRRAYPEKDAAWIETTLRGAWENLGRVVGEYVHLGELWDFDPNDPDTGRILVDKDALALFDALGADGKPALCFAAHLANWELPALSAARHGLASAVVYRMPNNRAVAAAIERIRGSVMGQLIRSRPQAVFEMATALDAGKHLGMLVDQHWSRGVDVSFFNRRCKANPTIARLARQYDCPVIGIRVIRLPGQRFRVATTGPLMLPRDAEGTIDVAASTQMINAVVETWVREHPEQWLWFHRRWRGEHSP